MTNSNLSGSQRKVLRGMAHNLKPVVQIGKHGLSEAVIESIEQALEDHELIKVKFGDLKDQKKAACAEVCERLRCEDVGTIGHVAIFFRHARDPEKRKIELS